MLNIKAICINRLRPENTLQVGINTPIEPLKFDEFETFNFDFDWPLKPLIEPNLPPRYNLPKENVSPSLPKTDNVVQHSAICDKCDKSIYGIRYKCSVCSDYDLCTPCEELNLTTSFHPQQHYFLKINKPSGYVPLHFINNPPQTRDTSKELEDRVAAAESRIQSLEMKFRACEVKSRWRKSCLKKQQLEEQSKAFQATSSKKKECQLYYYKTKCSSCVSNSELA